MKKTITRIASIILCLLLALSLFACEELGGNIGGEEQGGEQGGSTSGGGSPENPLSSISQETWAEMLRMEAFENVTFLVKTITDDEEDGEIYKLVGDRCAYVGKDGDKEAPEDQDIAAQIRSMFITTIMKMLEVKEHFTLVDNKFQNATDTIVYTITVMGVDAEITASNIVLELTDDLKVATVSGHMIQNFTENNTPHTLEFDFEFKFYDYGTTVITPASDTPQAPSISTGIVGGDSSPSVDSDKKDPSASDVWDEL